MLPDRFYELAAVTIAGKPLHEVTVMSFAKVPTATALPNRRARRAAAARARRSR